MSLLLLFQNRSRGQPSGGWKQRDLPPGLRAGRWTEEEEARRVLEERIRLGIIVPEPGDQLVQTDKTDKTYSTSAPLASRLLPEDFAGLEALAARSAAITIDEALAARARDEEIAHLLRLARRRSGDDEFLMLWQ